MRNIVHEQQPDKHSERVTQNYAASFYEDIRYVNPAARQYYDWFFRKLFALARPYGRILDNGCGNGILADYLPGVDIVGVDLSEEMIARAKRRLRQAVVADSQALPFPDNSFDTVVSISVLHHLPNPEKGVAEVARVLKPGGSALFEEVVKTAVSAVPRFFLNRFSSHFSHEHKNFSKSQLLGIIGRHLQLTQAHHYGYLAYPLLGFPDIIDFQKYLPFKKAVVPALLGLDDFLERLPLIKTQSWNILIAAHKKNS